MFNCGAHGIGYYSTYLAVLLVEVNLSRSCDLTRIIYLNRSRESTFELRIAQTHFVINIILFRIKAGCDFPTIVRFWILRLRVMGTLICCFPVVTRFTLFHLLIALNGYRGLFVDTQGRRTTQSNSVSFIRGSAIFVYDEGCLSRGMD